MRCALESYDLFCGLRSAGLCGRLLRAIRIFGRGRNVVAFSGSELLDVGQPAERLVQDAQDRRKVAPVRHISTRQVEVEAAFVEEADINLLRGARGLNLAI